MTPEQNRNGFPVEMKELKEDGLSDETLKFPSYREVDKFVHRGENYVYGIVKKSKEGKRKRIDKTASNNREKIMALQERNKDQQKYNADFAKAIRRVGKK